VTRFDGRTVLITGGARGQGLSHALAFAGEGADIVLCDIAAQIETAPYSLSSRAQLDAAAEKVAAAGARCLALQADVRDAQEMQAVVDTTVERFGRLDIVCANAGISSYSAVDAMTTQMWNETLDVNLTGVFNTVRAAIPPMKAAGYGRIIATSSIAGRSGQPNISHYVASKWAVIGFIKSVALELGRSGITANVVAPTNVDTDMIQHQAFYNLLSPAIENPTREDAARVARRMTGMGIPWIDIADVTHAVLFLADEGSRYISGEVLHVSAGGIAFNTA
jgi:SDR family mycofactocin-dependent oxidoreductase